MTRRQLIAIAALVAVLAIGAVAALTVPRLLARSTGEVPHFVEEATAAGVAQSYTGDFDYFIGGGVAAFDCNDDGRPDLYFAGGTSPAGLFVNQSQPGKALSFSHVSSTITDLTEVIGAYPIDIDGDGMTDLAVLRNGTGNVLLRGLGGCQFQPANEQWGFDGGNAYSTAFSAKWDKGASWPTVAIGNYLSPVKPDVSYDCVDDQIFHPAPAGAGFVAPVPLSPSWCTLSLLFTDWDRSGRRDLRVSNDRQYYTEYSGGQEQLWRVPSSGAPSQYSLADGWQPLNIFGMGIADYDVNSDGYPDYYLTSQADNKLQFLANGPSSPNYVDRALPMHATATRPYTGDVSLASTAWHDEFQDVNNDGLIDLYVSKGNVDAMPDLAAQDPSNLMIGQADETFLEGGTQAGIDAFDKARGAALVDLNGDGMLDLVIVDRMANVRMYRNVGSGTEAAPRTMGNWLGLQLRQDDANRDAIGSWIEVKTDQGIQQRELTIGGGHASGELVPVHFGLGNASSAQVRITWPDGQIGQWQSVDANQTYVIQPNGAPIVVSQ
ncbi:MAG TPA: CRTAC1 family protein [Candidatus Limnocylindrales bacterium]